MRHVVGGFVLTDSFISQKNLHSGLLILEVQEVHNHHQVPGRAGPQPPPGQSNQTFSVHFSPGDDRDVINGLSSTSGPVSALNPGDQVVEQEENQDQTHRDVAEDAAVVPP